MSFNVGGDHPYIYSLDENVCSYGYAYRWLNEQIAGELLNEDEAEQQEIENGIRAWKIWNETVPIVEGSLPARYFRETRLIGIQLPPTIRAHGMLWHQSKTYRPAWIGKVTTFDDTFSAIHRGWLDDAEKIKHKTQRASLGPTAGNAIRLAPAAPLLLLGEGIETVLAAMELSGHPGWSAIHAWNMKYVQFPPIVREVIILQDNDKSRKGEREARWAYASIYERGLKVSIQEPIDGCKDFNDELIARKKNGLR